jgi:hypothetical protein
MDFYDTHVERSDPPFHTKFFEKFSGDFEYFFFGPSANAEEEKLKLVYEEFIFKLAVVARAAFCAVIDEMM